MANDTIYGKTGQGQIEVKARSGDLTAIQRRILILTDGRRSAETIGKISKTPDCQNLLEQLVEDGYLEIIGTAVESQTATQGLGGQTEPTVVNRFDDARQYMLSSLTSHGNPARIGKLVGQIEQAEDMMELTRFVDTWYQLISDNPNSISIVDGLRKTLIQKLSAT